MHPRPVVCLSAQSWDLPLRTNRHRISEELARRGHRVLYVETGGWIVPYLLRGGLPMGRRLRRLHVESVAPNVLVRRALTVLPLSWRFPLLARINARIEAFAIRRMVRSLELRDFLTVVYDPRAIETATRLGGACVLYDCVDDHEHTVTQRYRAPIARFDRDAGRRADVVATTTRPLHERHSAHNPRTYLIPNVADYEHFSRTGRAEPEALRRLRGPILGFAGNLLALKVDFELIAEAAALRPGWSFVLLGPVGADSRPGIDAVRDVPNVALPGLVAYEELPAWIARFDVGLIPYRSNDYTRSVFPLKLYEYLAAGLPVVVSGIPSVPELAPDVLAVEDAEGLVRAIEAQLESTSDADVTRRQAIAAEHTWRDRVDSLLTAVDSAFETSA
jgi:glycosyltransferase involved in cell wall biosynthesis